MSAACHSWTRTRPGPPFPAGSWQKGRDNHQRIRQVPQGGRPRRFTYREGTRTWGDRSSPVLLPGSPTTAPDEFRRFDDIPEGATVYVSLAEKDGVWSASSVRRTPPAMGVFIRGVKRYSRIEYGIDRYYIPEEARQEISNDLLGNMRDARVHVKIDSTGHAVIEYLTIRDRVYRY
ncbi:MAG: GDYXXLXY domain-containing protein [Planctomycetota bacterium]